MKLNITKVPAVRGLIGTTYAVRDDEKILKIFLTKREAEEFVETEGKK